MTVARRVGSAGTSDSVSAHDAAYVALAEALGAILVTADTRLAAAHGPRCAIEVLQA